uniref:Uncharacterized protein n=1 Tax=Spongospora subterranea TaxID=70186 RepID=A0A0H5QV44_9EUKA|eukprot:CRZ05853.1 hypothetical protein [Spongospora subterranea]
MSHIRAFTLPESAQVDLLHITGSARMIVASHCTIYLYTCNARLLRTLDWQFPITCITSNRLGDFIVIGGRGSSRVTIHSFCEMDLIQEIDIHSRTLAPGVFSQAMDISLKENTLVIAMSDQSVLILSLPTNHEQNATLVGSTFEAVQDIAHNAMDGLLDTMESPLAVTKQALSQANTQIVDVLDRGAGNVDVATSNIWSSLSKAKGKFFGGPKQHS